MSEKDIQTTASRDNPYVGPRAFEETDQRLYFGRFQEADDILSLLMARKILLLYAQSGAGKTSIIKALLKPELERSGPSSDHHYSVASHRQFEVLPIGRVSDAVTIDDEPDNQFAFNLMVSLAGEAEPERFASLRLSDFLLDSVLVEGELIYTGGLEPADEEAAADTEADDEQVDFTVKPRALIIDQFEELFTYHPELEDQRVDFLRQIAEAMENDPYLYVLLSMRDDYLARISPYVQLLHNGLRTRYYMQRMEEAAALDAIRLPPEQLTPSRRYDPEVPEKLVYYLRRSGTEVNGMSGQLDPYIEPVQLQVVCYQLWESLDSSVGSDITMAEVDAAIMEMLHAAGRTVPAEVEPLSVFIDTALADYYEQAIAGVLHDPAVDGVEEYALRSFFGKELITLAGVRNLVSRGDEATKGIPEAAVKLLEDRYHIIRNDMRGGRPFVELVHDSFIPPIREANLRWEDRRLQQFVWLADARAYAMSPDTTPLLTDQNLEKALEQAQALGELPEEATAYLQASQDAQQASSRKRLVFSVLGLLALLLLLSSFTVWVYRRNQDLTEQSIEQEAEAESLRLEADRLTVQAEELAHETKIQKLRAEYQGRLRDEVATELNSLENQRNELAQEKREIEALRLTEKARGYAANGEYDAAILFSRYAADLLDAPRTDMSLLETMGMKLVYGQGSEELPARQLHDQYDLDVEPAALFPAVQPDAQGLLPGSAQSQDALLFSAQQAPTIGVSAGSEQDSHYARLFPGPEPGTLGMVLNGRIVYWTHGAAGGGELQEFILQVGRETAEVDVAAFSPDRQLLVTATGPELRLWWVPGRESEVLGEGATTISAVAFSADGSRLAVARSCPERDAESCSQRIIEIWQIDPAARTAVNDQAAIQTGSHVGDLTFMEDGEALLWSGPTFVRRHDLASGESVRIAGFQPPVYVTSLAFVPVENILVIAGCEESTSEVPPRCGPDDFDFLQWWHLSDLSLPGLRTITDRGLALADVAYVPGDEDIVFIDGSSSLSTWSADMEEYRASACQIAGRSLTASERQDAFASSEDYLSEVTTCDKEMGAHISVAEAYVRDCRDRESFGKARDAWEKIASNDVSLRNVSFEDWASRILTAEILQLGVSDAAYCLDNLGELQSGQTSAFNPAALNEIKRVLAEAEDLINAGDFTAAVDPLMQAEADAQQMPSNVATILRDELSLLFTASCQSNELQGQTAEEVCSRIPLLAVDGTAVSAEAGRSFWRLDAGPPGSLVTVDVNASQGDAWLALYDSAFNEIDFNHDSEEGLDPRLEIFQVDGESYYLEVGWSEEPEPYAISATATEAQSLQLGNRITADADQHVWRVQGQPGDHVVVTVNVDSEESPFLEVYDSEFQLITYQDTADQYGLRVAFILPDEQPHILRVDWPFYIPAEPYTLSTVVKRPQEFALGDFVEGPAEQYIWQFDGRAGDLIALEIVQDVSNQRWIELRDPQGRVINFRETSGGLNPRIERQLDVSGTYYVVSGWYGTEGPFGMTTSKDTPADVSTAGDSQSFGVSTSGRPLTYEQFGNGSRPVLFIGGIHGGYAPSSIDLAGRLADHLRDNPEDVPENVSVYIIPNLNPDSKEGPGETDARFNANGVDLNRNWDCKWQPDANVRGRTIIGSGGVEVFSEPEVVAARDFILDLQPEAVIAWDARASNGLVSAGLCSDTPAVSQPLADLYGEAAGFAVYDWTTSSSQVTGDSTDWMDSMGIPAAFVMLHDYDEYQWEENLAGVRALLDEIAGAP